MRGSFGIERELRAVVVVEEVLVDELAAAVRRGAGHEDRLRPPRLAVGQLGSDGRALQVEELRARARRLAAWQRGGTRRARDGRHGEGQRKYEQSPAFNQHGLAPLPHGLHLILGRGPARRSYAGRGAAGAGPDGPGQARQRGGRPQGQRPRRVERPGEPDGEAAAAGRPRVLRVLRRRLDLRCAQQLRRARGRHGEGGRSGGHARRPAARLSLGRRHAAVRPDPVPGRRGLHPLSRQLGVRLRLLLRAGAAHDATRSTARASASPRATRTTRASHAPRTARRPPRTR